MWVWKDWICRVDMADTRKILINERAKIRSRHHFVFPIHLSMIVPLRYIPFYPYVKQLGNQVVSIAHSLEGYLYITTIHKKMHAIYTKISIPKWRWIRNKNQCGKRWKIIFLYFYRNIRDINSKVSGWSLFGSCKV